MKRIRVLHTLPAPIRFGLTLCLLASIAWILTTPLAGGFGSIDLIQYWTASKLYLSGQNPYDSNQMAAIQESIRGPGHNTILLWNPPPVFTFIWPLALLSFPVAGAFWTLISATLIVYSCIKLVSLRPRSESFPGGFDVFILLTFYPFISCLGYGQISFLLLLGLALALYLEQSEDRKKLFLSGIALSLTLLKPHLLYLLYIVIAFRELSLKRTSIILGFIAGGVTIALLPLLFHENIYQYYFDALNVPPIYFQTPTLGSWLQALTGVHTVTIRMLPSVITAIGLIAFLIITGRDTEGTPLSRTIIPLSLLTSPYGWVFDQVLILPALIWILQGKRLISQRGQLAVTATLIGAHLLMLGIGGIGQQFFVWYPALLVAISLVLSRTALNSR